MRKRLLTVAMCLALGQLTTTLWAQAVQTVVVKEYQAKNQKTPLASVGVTVTNAGAVETDAEGRASLRFRSLKAGDRVTLRRVEKAGYEVFNSDAVEQWTVSPSTDFQLVLCRSDKFRQLRDQYQRVASQSYDRQYRAEQQRLANQRKEGKLQEEAYQQRLLDLQDQYEQQLEDLENYVDKFARIDLSELTAQEQELVELVQQGRIDEAIALYEQHDYLGQYERETRDIEEIDRAQQQLAQLEEQKRRQREAVMASISRQVNTYQLAGGRENFEKIGKLLKGVADADTTNVEALMLYAEFAAQQRNYDETDKYANIMLRVSGSDYARLTEAYTSLFVSSGNRTQPEKALQYIDMAIETSRLLDFNIQHNVKAAAYCLYLKHNYLSILGLYEDAEKMAGELAAYFNIIINDPAEPDVDQLMYRSKFMANRALALCDAGNIIDAALLCKESQMIVLPYLDEKDLNQVNSYWSILLCRMLILEVQEKWIEQISIMEEGVRLYSVLYKYNSEAVAPILFECYANLADALVQNTMLDKAEKYIQEAIILLDSVHEKVSVEAFAINEMGFYDTVASFYQKRGEYTRCLEYARLCLTAFELIPDVVKANYIEVQERWQKVVLQQ